jgi:hypothetical protein
MLWMVHNQRIINITSSSDWDYVASPARKLDIVTTCLCARCDTMRRRCKQLLAHRARVLTYCAQLCDSALLEAIDAVL